MIYLICLAVAVFVLAVDLTTKYLAVSLNFNVEIIPELLKFKLTYNTGAAFSFLSEKDWAMTFFKITTSIALLLILGFFIYNFIKKRKIKKWLAISLSLVFSGGLGNLIDRIALGKVRDFIFVFYNTRIFPAIFNVADMALVIGVIMLCFYLLFLDDDAVFKVKKQTVKEENNEDNG